MSILLQSRKIFVPLSLRTDTVRLVQLVEHQIVVLGVVGSSPTSHPKLERERFSSRSLFVFPSEAGCAFCTGLLFSGSLINSLEAIFSFLVFVILDAGLSPFWYLWHSLQAMPSHFWLCGIRYRRGPAMVRNMRAVLKKASWGTRRIFRGIRCKKQAFPVQKGYSVRRTAFCGTRRIIHQGYSVPEPPFYGTEQDSSNRKRVSLALLRN